MKLKIGLSKEQINLINLQIKKNLKQLNLKKFLNYAEVKVNINII